MRLTILSRSPGIYTTHRLVEDVDYLLITGHLRFPAV